MELHGPLFWYVLPIFAALVVIRLAIVRQCSVKILARAQAGAIAAALMIGATLMMLLLSNNATAQQISPEIRSACQKDFQTYCASVTPGDGRIRACMRANADKLSSACRAALRAARSAPQGSS